MEKSDIIFMVGVLLILSVATILYLLPSAMFEQRMKNHPPKTIPIYKGSVAVPKEHIDAALAVRVDKQGQIIVNPERFQDAVNLALNNGGGVIWADGSEAYREYVKLREAVLKAVANASKD